MARRRPHLFIIAGCNGAGKTTASKVLLPKTLGVKEFVNADAIAAGLSPFNVESVAFQAGRLMLERIDELLEERETFSFETTLSARSYVSLIRRARESGYHVTLNFIYLASPEIARARVLKRVRQGGHSIPADVIARRYYRGIENFIEHYSNVVNEWYLFENFKRVPELFAFGRSRTKHVILSHRLWENFLTSS